MRFSLSGLAMTASVLASANAIAPHDIPSDLPVSSLLVSAQNHLAKGETNEALTYYDIAIVKDPTNYLSFFKRATAYLSLGRATQATDDFRKVLDLKPGFHGAHIQLAKIKSKTADWEDALAEYTAAGKSADSPEVEELLGAQQAADAAVAAKQKGAWDECVNNAGTAIVVAPRSPVLREIRSHCRFERGELEEAMGDLLHILQLRPGDTKPHVVISATTFYGLGDMERGIAQVRKCLHSDPESKVCKKLHRSQKAIQKAYQRAQTQVSKGQFTTAGKTLVGTNEDPGIITLVMEQAEELRKEGLIAAQSRIQLSDQLVELVCQTYSESSHKDANKYCDEAVQLDDNSFWGMLHRGKTLLKEEDFEGAVRTLEQLIKARPEKKKEVMPLYNKAEIALKRSKTKDYYKVLGVANDADEKQIKSAYRKASKKFHPDKAAKQGISKEDAEKKMASINEAYEVLSNPELRARFDNGDDPNSQERPNNFHGHPFAGGHPFMFQQGGGGGGQRVKFEFGGGGFPFGF